MQLCALGLTKEFADLTAVDCASFELPAGEIWGFIGPNGAGKTTTLRMLATIDEPTAGDALIGGHSVVHEADKVRRILGFMPDYFGAYPNMRVSEYLDFFARAYGMRNPERARRMAEIVDFIEIGPLLSKQVSELSKGMRQRISLGRAMLHDPQVLLLDEPAAGLDPQARHDLQELLRVLASDGKTIFISSHILAELEEIVDAVVIISEGKLVHAGKAEIRHTDGTRTMTLDIRIIGDLPTACRLMLETPSVLAVHPMEPDGMRVEISGDKEQVAVLVQALTERGIVPYMIGSERGSLERLFLETTRNQ